MDRKLIWRTDDFGSAKSANEAILEGARAGHMVRSVSCMAPCAHIAEGAPALAACEGIDVGLHFTINSEWDRVRWGPVLDGTKKAGVTDEAGYFLPSPEDFDPERTDIGLLLREFDAQLDLLTRLGLKIVYADTHMFPEFSLPALMDPLRERIRKHGLIDAHDFYRMPPSSPPDTGEDPADAEKYLDSVEEWLCALPEGGPYWAVMHPAKAGEDTLLFANSRHPEGEIMRRRKLEYLCAVTPRWERWKEEYGMRLLCYSEAAAETG